jgi:hypothetical protein
MVEEFRQEAPWPLRAILLLVLGGLGGLLIHLLLRGQQPWQWTELPWRVASAAFFAVAFVTFAFSLERLRWTWSAGFAIGAGLVIAFVTWSNGPYGGWGSNEGWQLFSCLLAAIIAVPLFQTARDGGRLRFDYEALHAHSWTNILLWGAAWAFVLAVFLLAQLLAELFGLIGIHALRDLLRKDWAIWLLVGSAFGAAVGLLRDRDVVLRMLRRVATAILSVLTPALALGLVLFVLALPFTGLQPLWNQTKATTPILLFCILGAFVLVNATIGNGPDEEPRSPLLRYGAMALAVVMLPLGAVAAISVAKRIGQYGYTPERLWAAMFVLIALAAGLLYIGSVLRRRRDWAAAVRRANIGLALGVCGLALFLALPILSFGAISARDQVARLESGRVAPEKFDWVALRYDFGPSGQRAVQRLARAGRDAKTRRLAAQVLGQKNRWDAIGAQQALKLADKPRRVLVVPRNIPLPRDLADFLFATGATIRDRGPCVRDGGCLVSWTPGADTAVVLFDPCQPDTRPGAALLSGDCRLDAALVAREGGAWRQVEALKPGESGVADRQVERRAALAGEVELREVSGRQVFVGGKPVGAPFVAAQPSAK